MASWSGLHIIGLVVLAGCGTGRAIQVVQQPPTAHLGPAPHEITPNLDLVVVPLANLKTICTTPHAQACTLTHRSSGVVRHTVVIGVTNQSEGNGVYFMAHEIKHVLLPNWEHPK